MQIPSDSRYQGAHRNTGKLLIQSQSNLIEI